MSRLPNYKLLYYVVLRGTIRTQNSLTFEPSRICVSELAREMNCSKVTVYKAIERVKIDVPVGNKIDISTWEVSKPLKKYKHEIILIDEHRIKLAKLRFNRKYKKYRKKPAGYRQHTKHGFTNELKVEIRGRDNNVCVLCEKNIEINGRQLDVHHINYDWKDNRPENLVSLCRECHYIAHNGLYKDEYRSMCEEVIKNIKQT